MQRFRRTCHYSFERRCVAMYLTSHFQYDERVSSVSSSPLAFCVSVGILRAKSWLRQQ